MNKITNCNFGSYQLTLSPAGYNNNKTNSQIEQNQSKINNYSPMHYVDYNVNFKSTGKTKFANRVNATQTLAKALELMNTRPKIMEALCIRPDFKETDAGILFICGQKIIENSPETVQELLSRKDEKNKEEYKYKLPDILNVLNHYDDNESLDFCLSRNLSSKDMIIVCEALNQDFKYVSKLMKKERPDKSPWIMDILDYEIIAHLLKKEKPERAKFLIEYEDMDGSPRFNHMRIVANVLSKYEDDFEALIQKLAYKTIDGKKYTYSEYDLYCMPT